MKRCINTKHWLGWTTHGGAVLCLFLLAHSVCGNPPAAAPVTGLAITKDGRHIVSVSQHGLQVRRFSDLHVIQQQSPSCLQLHDVKFNSDNTRVAVAGGNPAEHGLVEVYTWPDLDLLWREQFSEDVFYGVSFQDETSLLAVAGHDREVTLRNMETGALVATLSGHSRPVTAVVFVAGTPLLLSSSLDQTIRVWQADTDKNTRSLNNHTGRILQMAVFAGTADQQPLLVSGGDDRTVRFWQPAIGRLLRFQRLSAAVTALDWTTSGQHAVAATADGQVLMIDRDTLQTQVVHHIPGQTVLCLAVHPDGDNVVIGTSQGQIQRVDIGQ